ncbi:MAG: glycosyltransferase [Bacteroidetes bacterium]|nr:glycosyltransferase [Bacteroidota bacterium]
MLIKKILIISSFFENSVGYQEVQFAEVLTSMNYEVKVIATNRSNLDLKKRYDDSFNNFEVRRIKKLTRIKNTFYPKEDLTEFFSNYNPDLVFLILPGSGAPYFLMKYINPNAKVVSVFSDTTIENRVSKAKGTKGNKLIFRLLKAKWYNKVFERSDLILSNTPETSSILKGISKNNIEDKLRMYGLGFDNNKYFYSNEFRTECRKQFGIKDDEKLIMTISRIYPGKLFEYWIEQVVEFLKNNSNYIYLLAGFSDTEYSRKVEENLKKLNLGDRLILHKFTTAEENNKLFNAADFSLWFAPTISIQQSMGTGLFPIVPYDSTLEHLVEKNKTGLYYNDFDELKKLLPELNNISYDRKVNSEFNQKFSYQSILRKVISEVN